MLEVDRDSLLSDKDLLSNLFANLSTGIVYCRLVYDDSRKPVDLLYLDMNKAYEQHFGFKKEEAIGRTSTELLPYLSKEPLTWIQPYYEVATTGKPWSYDRNWPSNGRWYHITLYRSKKDHIIALTDDITERLKAEEELKRSNEELQQFAYVASHDLQEPLRMITSYLGLLDKKFGNELRPQAKQYMDFAVDGSMRMKELIDDLLQYSRIDSRSIILEKIDMNDKVKKIAEDLHVAIKETGAEVVVAPLPTICADKTQIKQLLTNLISNAIKFHSDRPPMIEISAFTYENEFVFSVKDNGIGIDPQYADKLFKMFSRLHTRDEYPGTGIGLAIAKKIVERHGGRIWFESEPDKGTTVYFTIPS